LQEFFARVTAAVDKRTPTDSGSIPDESEIAKAMRELEADGI
jgi:hypothetical protein